MREAAEGIGHTVFTRYQTRDRCGSAELSGARRASFDHTPPDAGMVVRLRPVCGYLRMDRISRTRRFGGSSLFSCASIAPLEAIAAVGCIGRGCFRSAFGDHESYFAGYCRGAAAVDRAALALSAQLDLVL